MPVPAGIVVDEPVPTGIIPHRNGGGGGGGWLNMASHRGSTAGGGSGRCGVQYRQVSRCWEYLDDGLALTLQWPAV